jgi:hypothetical protein
VLEVVTIHRGDLTPSEACGFERAIRYISDLWIRGVMIICIHGDLLELTTQNICTDPGSTGTTIGKNDTQGKRLGLG